MYASSSSVYGANTTMPFSVHDNVDHPLSLYAATKKANELMAHTYSHLFQLPTTGLRFFTVYGPWGRPDMALFLDGVNDFYLFDGRPVTWGIFTEALDVHNREQYETILHRRTVRPKWQKLSQFVESLPLSRGLYLLGDLARRRNATAETVLYKPAPMTPIADGCSIPGRSMGRVEAIRGSFVKCSNC